MPITPHTMPLTAASYPTTSHSPPHIVISAARHTVAAFTAAPDDTSTFTTSSLPLALATHSAVRPSRCKHTLTDTRVTAHTQYPNTTSHHNPQTAASAHSTHAQTPPIDQCTPLLCLSWPPLPPPSHIPCPLRTAHGLALTHLRCRHVRAPRQQRPHHANVSIAACDPQGSGPTLLHTHTPTRCRHLPITPHTMPLTAASYPTTSHSPPHIVISTARHTSAAFTAAPDDTSTSTTSSLPSWLAWYSAVRPSRCTHSHTHAHDR